ncbi:MAG: DUF3007 family protein [Chroococcidiopsidaceae cyanobacterium CP_BM_RX_35]|nr:DUF3007 family protein [Chroococcidiopsidaceae cyanobacterium CP_BM_RX_35]
MRRIDAIGIALGIFAAAGLAYTLLQVAGLDNLAAGVWSQVFLVGGLIGWLVTYIFRVVGHKMTYHQQRQDYEEAFLQKRLESLTPEELAKLQAEIEQEQTRGGIGRQDERNFPML